MANEVAEKKDYTTAISEWNNTFTNLIARDYKAVGVEFDDYSKKCAMEAMTSIYQLVKASDKVDMNGLDTSNLREVIEHCASLKLNASAFPRECYFQLRSKKIGNNYVQTVEMGVEGAGNDAMLRNFGVGVEQVYPYWIVKDGDYFKYPKRKGIEIEPPEWEEKGLSQKCVRVVYPVKVNGEVTYLIAERDSVKINLLAHVKQNLMNETFGICENRYKATDKQKKEIEAKKQEIYAALRKCSTVDEMLECEIAMPYMSGAWLDTPESMIQRKMLNNATKKFPKNYNAMAKKASMEMDETYQQVQEEIEVNANQIPFEDMDDDAEVVDGEIVEEQQTLDLGGAE